MSERVDSAHSTRRFVDFVREIEGKLTDDERRELDAWREHFRDSGDEPLGMREPAPTPPKAPGDYHVRMDHSGSWYR